VISGAARNSKFPAVAVPTNVWEAARATPETKSAEINLAMPVPPDSECKSHDDVLRLRQ